MRIRATRKAFENQNDRGAEAPSARDFEALALSQNKRFWKLIDKAIEQGKKEGYVDLEDL